MARGYGLDIYGPTIFTPSAQVFGTGAAVTWSTNEVANGKVYYSTLPFGLQEATGNFTEPTIMGGQSVLTVNAQSNQSVSIQNLQPNTVYYYIVESTDLSGNVTITWPTTFKTNY